MKLSTSQLLALSLLSDGPMNDFWAAATIGAQREKVLRSLERRGLVRWAPYGGERREGTWRITPDGRQAMLSGSEADRG